MHFLRLVIVFVQCISSMDLVARVSSVHPPDHHTAAPKTPADTATAPAITGSPNATASNASAVGTALALAKEQLSLNAKDFAAICPILLYQLTANTSREKAGCIDEHLIASDFSGHRHAEIGSDGVAQENRWLGKSRFRSVRCVRLTNPN